MGWIHESIHCRRCDYEYAEIRKHNNGHWNIIFCDRCGYSKYKKFDYDKYEALKNDPEHKNDDDKKLLEQSTECKVIFPSGSYIYRIKGEDRFRIDSIEEGSIEKLIEHLDEYDICKYTFYKHRSWYIKDLHSNTTTLFSEKEYFMCEDGESDMPEKPNFKLDGIFVSWFNL